MSDAIREIVGQCLELDRSQRDAFLAGRCGGDAALLERARRLVRAHELAEGTGFLDPGTIAPRLVPPDRAGSDPLGLVGAIIGKFRVVRQIGTGGMGSVYEAEQEDPRRSVALKVMRAGLLSEPVLRRFDYEAQVLARLRHPGVAQIFEAGTQLVGTMPVRYYAMELIPDARPITAYAIERGLPVRERISLFASVCDAVHHGHQKGVIHRDLKPGNILVDAAGQAKVIDFGVARAIDRADTRHTEAGQIVGTLQYMSPEQCGPEAGDVDVRSDVYSLGVVLYELLCDRPPYDLSTATIPEAVRIVREHAPERPSAVARLLRGDLETIALKALEKERERRYQSADELGQDLRRFLAGEQITARPATLTYQLRVFARTHRPVVVGGVAAVVALMAGVVGTGVGLYRATQARDRALRSERDARIAARHAHQVAEFLKATIMTADPGLPVPTARGVEPDPLDEPMDIPVSFAGSRPDQLTVQDLLTNAATRLESEFPNDPLTRAELADALGWTLRTLGLLEPAIELLRLSFELRTRLLGPDHEDTLRTAEHLAFALENAGTTHEAQAMYRDILERRLRTLGPADRRTIIARFRLAGGLGLGSSESREQLGIAIGIAGERLGVNHPLTLRLETVLGLSMYLAGSRDEGIAMLRRAIDGLRRSAGPAAVPTALGELALADVLANAGALDEAEVLARGATESLRSVYPASAARLRAAENQLCGIYRRQGRIGDAIVVARRIVEIGRRVDGPDHPTTLRQEDNLARLLTRPEVVRPEYEEEAEILAAHAAEAGERILTLADGNAVNYAITHASVVRKRGRAEEALAILDRLQEKLVAIGRPPEGMNAATFDLIRGDALVDLERFAEAEPPLLEAYEALKGVSPEYRDRVCRALIALYERWGRPAEADRYRDPRSLP